MLDEVWEKILHDYILPYKEVNRYCPPTFISHKDTEPLINKHLPDRLRSLAVLAPDMKIDIYSNGVLLPVWRDRGQDFIEFLATLPNKVRFMMSYHPKNHDWTVNDYGPTIEYLKHVLRNPPPNVEFITVSHKSKWVSEETQNNWRATWAGLPITVHCNCSINPWTGRIESDLKFCGCPYADFGHWFFGVTGNVITCCLDLEEEIVLGNVLTHDPEEMFAKTERFYEDQRHVRAAGDRPTHDVCSDCFGFKRLSSQTELVQLGGT